MKFSIHFNFCIFTVFKMNVFRKISTIMLALLVLLSTFSVTIEKHFCGDYLVDVSYFGNSKGCADEDEENCSLPAVITKKNCCKDEVQHIEGQDELRQTSIKKIKVEQQKFLLAFAFSYQNLFANLSKQIVPHQYYSPPEVVDDLQVLHEVFII